MVAGDRLIELPQFLERIAKVAMRLGKIGRDRDGFLKSFDGVVEAFELVVNASEPNSPGNVSRLLFYGPLGHYAGIFVVLVDVVGPE